MIQNQLKLIPLTDIKVSRESRQRKQLTPASVYDLALNIARNGLLQNIGVRSDTMEVVFGERRFTAIWLINLVIHNLENANSLLPPDKIVDLSVIAQENNQYEHWTKIPARLIKSPSNLSAGVLEFVENVAREDLPWQDKAEAAYALHKECLAACKARNDERPEGAPIERWPEQATADMLGITRQYLNQLIQPLRELETASEKSKAQIKDAIQKSTSHLSAGNAVKAIKERHGDKPAIQGKLSGRRIGPEKEEPETESEEKEEAHIPILNADFHNWIASAEQQYNFIHCDFPYGIGYNTGGNFSTNQANVQQGQYDDSEVVYWTLCKSLVDFLSKGKPDCHIMFWYSQNLETETCVFFDDYLGKAPGYIRHKHKMIWVHPSKQTTPDPLRYGQRNYETAMLLTLGDRKIVRPKRLAFVHDEQVKIHRSQKPLAVLSHFFEMFVDGSTRMLDPTCGSSTSLIAAKKLGAAKVLGLEIDPAAHEQAVKHWSSMCG